MKTQATRLVTVRSACELMQIGRTTLYQLCNCKAIQSIRIGSRGIRIPMTEIDRFIQERLSSQ
jgi:excisionase family DNA binding protein